MPQTGNPINLTRTDREQILNAIVKRIRKSHFNIAGVNYDDWQADLDRRRPDLLTADLPCFEEGVRSWLQGLKSSHTNFYHGIQNRFLPQHTINATVEETEYEGENRWRILDIFPEGPADVAGLREGDVLLRANGQVVEGSQLPTFETGRRHELEVAVEGGSTKRQLVIDVPYRKGTKDRPPIVEPKAITASRKGRVGTLKIPYFSGSVGLEFMKDLKAEMDRFAQAEVEELVIDVRGNIGGSLGFAGMASYLCPGQSPIGFSLTPKTLRQGYDKHLLPKVPMPRNRVEFTMTMGRFLFRDKSVVLMTQGLGPQRFHGRIQMLVNRWTNSAGEMLAAFAQESGAATVVGGATAGNVLGATNARLPKGYWLRIPIFGWFTWEGTVLERVIPTAQ